MVNIKKHEISWSKRNSPNYYNLANIQRTAHSIQYEAQLICDFRYIRWETLFVDTQYILYVSHTYLLFCLHKLFSISIYVCQMVTIYTFIYWYLFSVCFFFVVFSISFPVVFFFSLLNYLFVSLNCLKCKCVYMVLCIFHS